MESVWPDIVLGIALVGILGWLILSLESRYWRWKRKKLLKILEEHPRRKNID
jgi:hypothetical protein